jgi:hypothetical protein
VPEAAAVPEVDTDPLPSEPEIAKPEAADWLPVEAWVAMVNPGIVCSEPNAVLVALVETAPPETAVPCVERESPAEELEVLPAVTGKLNIGGAAKAGRANNTAAADKSNLRILLISILELLVVHQLGTKVRYQPIFSSPLNKHSQVLDLLFYTCYRKQQFFITATRPT